MSDDDNDGIGRIRLPAEFYDWRETIKAKIYDTDLIQKIEAVLTDYDDDTAVMALTVLAAWQQSYHMYGEYLAFDMRPTVSTLRWQRDQARLDSIPNEDTD